MDSSVDRSTTWPYRDGEPGPFSYSRDNHPTGVACEEAIAELEGGGRSLLFPSGMGAVTTVLLTLAGPGQTVAIAEAAYYGHAQLVRLLEPWGLRLVEFDPCPAFQPVGPAIEPRADYDNTQIGMRGEFLTQKIIDDAVPRDVGTIRTSFIFELLEDS